MWKRHAFGISRRAHRAASIEPHSYECGNHIRPLHLSIAHPASIEPHSYECGNGARRAFGLSEARGLQLSHIHMNVETREVAEALADFLDASIEPHSYECGNATTEY